MSIQVNSTIKLNTQILNQLDTAQTKAMGMSAEATLTEIRSSNVIPFRDGNLQNNLTFVDHSNESKGKVSIVSSGPYARRLYFHPEYNFSKMKNSSAGGKWFEEWQDGKFIKKAYAAFFKKLGNL